MFARITHYKLKPDSIEAATTLLEELRPQIMAMPGMVRFINAHHETGAGYAVSILESKDIAEANAAAVQAVWSHFADHLEAMPAAQGFHVAADWSD